MSNTDEIRWKQRMDHFKSALSLLRTALEDRPLDEYSDLEQEGIIQRFEYTFELAWKTMRDLLFYEGYDEPSPRSVIRRAFEMGYVSEDDVECWFDALEKRNLLSHTYRRELAVEALDLISNRYATILYRLHALLERKREER